MANSLLPQSATASSQRPCGLRPLGNPPTQATIEAKYGWHEGQPDEESYSAIDFSLFDLGDFGRYVVESGLHHFSRYQIGKEYPDREPREPRIIKRRMDAFLKSLTDEQAGHLKALSENSDGPPRPSVRFRMALTEEQLKLLSSARVYPKVVDDSFPSDLARRWIFQRTLSLGWSPKLFGREDRYIGHGSGRESHKAERWGKKYQWMAYHELLARVADNYQSARRYGTDTPYEGLHQITAEREIDPSLPPIDYRAFNDNGGADLDAWDPSPVALQEWPPVRLNFDQYKGDIKRFLADKDSEPTFARTLLVRDRTGEQWVVLSGFLKQVDPQADKGWRGLQQKCVVSSVLVPVRQAKSLIAALPSGRHTEIMDLTDTHGHVDCCYVGEVGRIGPACPHQHDGLAPVEIDGATWQVVSTTEEYRWEGSILDCSIGESASTILPSTFLQQAAHLSFDMRGPSWLDPSGTPVFTYYTEPGNDSHALLVKASFLKEFLTNQKLEMVAFLWFERMLLRQDYHDPQPYIESASEARVGRNLAFTEGVPRRTERSPTAKRRRTTIQQPGPEA